MAYLNGLYIGVTNHLLTGMILQVLSSVHYEDEQILLSVQFGV